MLRFFGSTLPTLTLQWLNGYPSLELFGPNGPPLIALSGGADGPSIDVCDSTGQKRATLGVSHLTMTRTGASVTTAPSKLMLYDKDGKVIFEAPRD